MSLTQPSPATTEDERAPLFYHRTFNSETSILSLPDILEERAGQHRQVEFNVENDEEHAQKATPDAHFEKLAGVGHDGRREKKGFRDLDQFFAKGHIFEDGPIGKSTELLEQCAADEKRLISINDPASNAAEIV